MIIQKDVKHWIVERKAICLISMLLAIELSMCQQKEKLFTSLEADKTGVTFANHIIETDSFNINEYLYAHNGGGVAIGDINQDGLPDIYFTANQLPNKLYLNKGNFVFEDVTQQANVVGLFGDSHWTTGAVMADVNGDGWLDIYVCQVSGYKSFNGRNQLFINNGAAPGEMPSFTESAVDFQLDIKSYAQQAAFFDYDLDGDLDMYLLNQAVHNNNTYVKAAFRSRKDSLAGDRLLRNDQGVFSDVTEEAGIYSAAMGYGLSVGIGDIDNNGWPDIYVSNDFHENDYVYYNNGDGTFREDVKGTLGHTSTFSMGNDVADVNNDGLLDIVTMDMKPEEEVIRKSSAGADSYDIYHYKLSYGYFYQYPRNMLHLNRGNLFEKNVQFSEVGQLAGIDATDWSWSVLLADLDNDGWKDVFITNGILRRPNDLDYINFTYNQEVAKKKSSLELAMLMPEGAVANYAYQNTGSFPFRNVSTTWGLDEKGYSMGAAYGDLDNDGDLDLVVNHLNTSASVYRNNAETVAKNNFLQIELKGQYPNMYGLGSRVSVETNTGTQVQELHISRGWLSSMEPRLTFGLGKNDSIKKVTVRWPDGSTQHLHDISVNQTLVIRQQITPQKRMPPPVLPVPLFEDITDQSGITFRHQENSFVDFNSERLLPHMLSREGPSVAVGDVNHDGLEDIFIGGAAGQAGALFLQSSERLFAFVESRTRVFEGDKEKEDQDAAFFDADGDGDMDLYVVSGGGQFKNNVVSQDRLYVNDGQGNFTKQTNALPEIQANGSCLVVADFDGDGNIDLFVGVRSVVDSYGLPPDSYLLWNNGKGQFVKDTSDYTQPLRQLGMVTGAVWLEGQKELVVVGEWMPITFLSFNKARISKREMPGTSGWWNTIYATDLNNDGKTDLLAGNMGLNAGLKATPREPVSLYVKDLDQNLSSDPILTYYRHHQEWVYPGLDMLKKQLPSIRLRYPDYASFADQTFAQIFPKAMMKNAVVKQVQMFQSVYLLNKGKDTYEIKELPLSVQYAPVNAFLVDDFDGDSKQDILAAGNFYDNEPGLGRYDASYGSFLKGQGNGDLTSVEPRESRFAVYGEVRDMKIIRSGHRKAAIISRNNSTPKLIQPIFWQASNKKEIQ